VRDTAGWERPVLSYRDAGATEVHAAVWTRRPAGFRRFERTVVIGYGDAFWEFACGEVMRWGVKRRSGFRVSPRTEVIADTDYVVRVGWGPVVVDEPVRVVDTVTGQDRCGFAYGTLRGHPISGEEAFVMTRAPSGDVLLSLRSLTRPAPQGIWRPGYPVLLLAQRFIRRPTSVHW
jgi:uncharacterized protein (UPF0548 family)